MIFAALAQFAVCFLILAWVLRKKTGEPYSRKAVIRFVDGSSYGDNGGYTAGLRNCTEVPNLFHIFDEMGMSEEDQNKIARGNFHRVIRQVLK